jgi:lysyl endopeptidase
VRPFCRLVLLLIALGGAVPAFAQSVSSAEVPHPPKAAHIETLRLPIADEATLVAFDRIDSNIVDAIRSRNTRSFTKRLQIGIGRVVTDPAQSSAALHWTAVPGGSAAQWKVVSLGAAALRVGLDASLLREGVELRFAGAAEPGIVYGPFTRGSVANVDATYWSPVLEGDSAIVEVFVPEVLSPAAARLRIAAVSHLFVQPGETDAATRQKATSEPCEVDLVCRSATDPALAKVGRAVAKMVFTESTDTFLCSGTLLNTSGHSGIPYFYSASQCINTQAVADTLTTHWFYERTGCGSGATSPSYTQLAGGATLVYHDDGTDVLLLRLNAPPPAGAVMAGWDATRLQIGLAVTGVHHPAGDFKKVTLGTFTNFTAPVGQSRNFILATWDSTLTGVTEVGSSGSGLFTAVGSPPTDYVLRGGEHGGPSDCSAPPYSLYDFYSRFDLAYGAALEQYLSDGAANHTALWWNPNESGWGINFNQQGDIVFGTLFTYDANGSPMWLVMSNGTRQSGETFSGALYRTSGPPFDAQPFTPIGPGNLTTVGTMSVTFSGDTATLSYRLYGIDVTKSIQKQVFGSRAASCVGTTADRSGLTNYQDLWWNPDESGWGINLTQQDDTIFATLFTYSANGNGLWLVMSAGSKQADGSYLGDLYQTRGPAFDAQPFTPIDASNLTRVGTMRLRFASGTTGTMTYSVNGVNVTKAITRQVFSSPLPACS